MFKLVSVDDEISRIVNIAFLGHLAIRTALERSHADANIFSSVTVASRTGGSISKKEFVVGIATMSIKVYKFKKLLLLFRCFEKA